METTPESASTGGDGGTGAGPGVRKTWSHSEFSLLLRAWTEAEKSNRRMPTARAVFERFQQLSVGGDSGRTEHSVLVKHKMALNAYDVMLVYVATHARDACSSSSGDGDDSTAMDAWFRLPRSERRRVFATLNRKTYPYVELIPEHAVTIEAMYRKYNKVPRLNLGRTSAPPSVAPSVPIAAKRERDDSNDDDDDEDKAFAQATHQFDVLLMRLRERERLDALAQLSGGDGASSVTGLGAPSAIVPVPVRDGDGNGDGADGSGTESEEDWDEIVPRSPVYGDALDNGTTAAPAPLKRRGSDSVGTVETLQEGTERSSKRQCVPPELLELASTLQMQVQTLKTIGDETKAAHVRAQMERQAIVRQLERDRVERQELLASVQGCYNVLQAQRLACRVEHVGIDRQSDLAGDASAGPSRGAW